MHLKATILIIVALMCALTMSNPLFGYSSRYSASRDEPYRGRSYNDIARVLNPSPYAFPRNSPFPSQPFWTYTG